MRSLLRSIAIVIAAQPFYAEEIRAIRMSLEMAGHTLPILDRLRVN